jgi:hypothetical protein
VVYVNAQCFRVSARVAKIVEARLLEKKAVAVAQLAAEAVVVLDDKLFWAFVAVQRLQKVHQGVYFGRR